MQNELKFNSLLELKTRLKPALNSKYLELKRKHNLDLKVEIKSYDMNQDEKIAIFNNIIIILSNNIRFINF